MGAIYDLLRCGAHQQALEGTPMETALDMSMVVHDASNNSNIIWI